jgi:hypothetical protein
MFTGIRVWYDTRWVILTLEVSTAGMISAPTNSIFPTNCKVRALVESFQLNVEQHPIASQRCRDIIRLNCNVQTL